MTDKTKKVLMTYLGIMCIVLGCAVNNTPIFLLGAFCLWSEFKDEKRRGDG